MDQSNPRRRKLLDDHQLCEDLEDARWQMAVAKSLVAAIEEEIAQLEAAPDLDEGGIESLAEDLSIWRQAYRLSALEVEALLEAVRKRSMSAPLLPVVTQASVAIAGPKGVLALG